MKNTITTATNGILFFQDLTLTAKPTSLFNLYVELQYSEIFFSKSTKTINYHFKGYVRNCLPGELYKQDESCFKCELSTYRYINQLFLSFVDPMTSSVQKCHRCPENAFCPGGKYVVPNQGYWRANNQTEKIIKCTSKEACLGYHKNNNEVEMTHGKCYESHFGNLCYYCKSGYAKMVSSGVCEKCADYAAVSYVKFFFILFAIFIYLIIYVKININLFSSKKIERRVLIKILLNHLQQTSIISLIDLGWTIEIKGFFSFQNYFSFFTDDLFSAGCIFANFDYDNHFLVVLYTTILPLILSLLSIVFWLLFTQVYFLYYKSSYSKAKAINNIRLFLLLSFYLLYPQIIKLALSLLNYDNSNLRVLSASPNIVCWNERHTLWVLALAIPSLIFWGLLVPFLIGFFMYKNKERIKNNIASSQINSNLKKKKDSQIIPEIIKSSINTSVVDINKKIQDMKDVELKTLKDTIFLGDLLAFFYKGYRENRYYWEVLIFFKKFVLTFIAIFSELFPTSSKSLLLLIILVIFIILNLKHQPYETSFLNKFDIASMVVTYITANIGILLWSKDLQVLGPVFLIIIVVANLGFFFVWTHFIFEKTYGQKYWLKIKNCCKRRSNKVANVPPKKHK